MNRRSAAFVVHRKVPSVRRFPGDLPYGFDVTLIATDASTGAIRTLTGSGRLANGNCDCPFLALHVDDGRLER